MYCKRIFTVQYYEMIDFNFQTEKSKVPRNGEKWCRIIFFKFIKRNSIHFLNDVCISMAFDLYKKNETRCFPFHGFFYVKAPLFLDFNESRVYPNRKKTMYFSSILTRENDYGEEMYWPRCYLTCCRRKRYEKWTLPEELLFWQKGSVHAQRYCSLGYKKTIKRSPKNLMKAAEKVTD